MNIKTNESEEKTMKKPEAIKYITQKGFTKRMAGKIYARAIEDVEVSADTLNDAIKATMNADNTNDTEKED